jgi:hypothetical protein
MAASNHSLARVLSFPAERRSSMVANWPVEAERRVKFRYPLQLSVRFRYITEGTRIFGQGLAINVSSGGVLVASEHQIVDGAPVKMSIEWPSLLDGKVPLQLIAIGWVLRRGTSHFAATFERYEFRTMRISSPQPEEAAALSGRGPTSPLTATPNP